jgi:hypothetical protein
MEVQAMRASFVLDPCLFKTTELRFIKQINSCSVEGSLAQLSEVSGIKYKNCSFCKILSWVVPQSLANQKMGVCKKIFNGVMKT